MPEPQSQSHPGSEQRMEPEPRSHLPGGGGIVDTSSGEVLAPIGGETLPG